MILHSTDNASLIYVKPRGLVYFTIVGFTGANEIANVVACLSENKTKLKSDKLLVDTSKLGVLRKSDFDLIINSILPVFRDIGIKKAALLKPEDVFGQSNIKELLRNVDNNDVMVFEDILIAEKWLLN